MQRHELQEYVSLKIYILKKPPFRVIFQLFPSFFFLLTASIIIFGGKLGDPLSVVPRSIKSSSPFLRECPCVISSSAKINED